MRVRRMWMVAGLLLGLAAPAWAEHHGDPYNRPGAFAGLGGSYAVSAFQGSLKDLFGDSLGFQARGGYRFNEFFALEGIYEYEDDFGARIGQGSLWTNAFTGNSKLILPLGRFQPYLSGGVGFLNVNASSDVDGKFTFLGRVAGGVDLALTERVAVFLDAAYNIPGGDGVLSDFQYFSFGWGGKVSF